MYFNIIKVEEAGSESESKMEKAWSLLKIANIDVQKNINREVGRTIRVSTCAVKNDMPKVKSKHLIFKTSIAGVKTHLLIDNKSEAKLIDESFMHANKIPSFKLKEPINFTLGNRKVV